MTESDADDKDQVDELEQHANLQLIAIGDRIRRRRRALDLTQGELASRAGISRAHVVAIESRDNATNFSVTALVRIAFALGCHPADLLGDGDRP